MEKEEGKMEKPKKKAEKSRKKAEKLTEEELKLIPKPKSKFLKVKCDKCSNEQIIFSAPASKVKCFVCESLLAEPGASKAKLLAKEVKELKG